MDNRCPECRRRFSGDLRFCPYCRTEARAPKTSSWRHADQGVVRYADPTEVDVRKCHRQNAFVLLSCAILLLPAWFAGAVEAYDIVTDRRWDWTPSDWRFIAIFLYSTLLALLVFWAISLAWRARRPLAQAGVAFLVTATVCAVFPPVLMLAGLLFCIVLGLAASSSGSFSDLDPSFLPVMSGIALACALCAYLYLMIRPVSLA